jgi:hypothetical protein
MSATNYSRADARSTIGGGTAPLTAPTAPGEFSAPACPPSLGGAVPPPFLWGMVQAFIPDVWPDGDPARLAAAATAWDTFSTTINGIAGECTGPSGVIGAQQIPEGGDVTSAISELSQSLSQVASEAGKLATQTLCADVEASHRRNRCANGLARPPRESHSVDRRRGQSCRGGRALHRGHWFSARQSHPNLVTTSPD